MSAQETVERQTIKPTFTPAAHGLLQRCTATQECNDCRKKRMGTLQRTAVNSSPVNDVPPIVHEVLNSPGQPLDAATRASMEPRFGHDFGNVRVHTDRRAADSAKAVDARAYTVGRSIVFGDRQYTPQSIAGQTLLAHELTHVVQQSRSGAVEDTSITYDLTMDPKNSALESEARSWAAKTDSQSESSPMGRASVALLQRQEHLDSTPETGGQLRAQSTVSMQPKTIIVIGSPSPSQAYGFQFVSAALCHPNDENTIWLVEHSGYEMIYGTNPSFITDQAPAGGYGWITASQDLVGWINNMPERSIGRLVVYSHGLPGFVALRYGWSDAGMPDYGLNLQDVARVNPSKFTPDAAIEFNSCNIGTATGQRNLAQSFADQVHRPVQAWTGRTSYAGINRGTCRVQGSSYSLSTDAIIEFWSRFQAGTTPQFRTFAPQRSTTP